MQTFLPHVDFVKSAECLDNKRLGKQRVEAATMIRLLGHPLPKVDGTVPTSDKWRNHVCTRMWENHVDALGHYMNVIIAEWEKRGMVNNMPLYPIKGIVKMPAWLGDERIHSSHRAALLFKKPEFYSKYNWAESPVQDYFWPVPLLTKMPTRAVLKGRTAR